MTTLIICHCMTLSSRLIVVMHVGYWQAGKNSRKHRKSALKTMRFFYRFDAGFELAELNLEGKREELTETEVEQIVTRICMKRSFQPLRPIIWDGYQRLAAPGIETWLRYQRVGQIGKKRYDSGCNVKFTFSLQLMKRNL